MNKTTEALKLAEEALNEPKDAWLDQTGVPKKAQALAAIRDALAKAVKQEPVALPICNLWVDPITKQYVVDHCDHPIEELIPAYAAPVQPVKQEPVAVVKESLTTELLVDALTSILKMDVKGYELQERLQFSPAGRQLLEKANNALSAPLQPVKQEPVAWNIKRNRPAYCSDDPTEVVALLTANPEPIGRLLNDGTLMTYPGKMVHLGDDLYAAPVGAKAILEMRDKAFQSYVDQVKADRDLSVLQARLEALEEAAKMAEAYVARGIGLEMAAAIRGLK